MNTGVGSTPCRCQGGNGGAFHVTDGKNDQLGAAWHALMLTPPWRAAGPGHVQILLSASKPPSRQAAPGKFLHDTKCFSFISTAAYGAANLAVARKVRIDRFKPVSVDFCAARAGVSAEDVFCVNHRNALIPCRPPGRSNSKPDPGTKAASPGNLNLQCSTQGHLA